jgi:hypothetical protein
LGLWLGFLFSLFHDNLRLDDNHLSRLDNVLGSSLSLRVIDDELNFFVTGESDAVSHFEVTVIFNADKFLINIVVADCERGLMINSCIGNHLASDVTDFLNGLEGVDSFDGGLIFTCEGKLDVKLA